MLLYYLSLVDTEEEKSKLENLYYEYKALMKYIAFNILGDNGLAEDAVHEAFIKLTRHLDGIGEIKSLKTKAFIVIISILLSARALPLLEMTPFLLYIPKPSACPIRLYG